MCTELILASFYLIILLIVNFFLFQVLKTYFQDIIYLRKIKKISEFFSPKNLELLFFCYEKKDKDFDIPFPVRNSEIQDILIIANFYNFLFKSKKKSSRIKFYLKLKEMQYFPSKILL